MVALEMLVMSTVARGATDGSQTAISRSTIALASLITSWLLLRHRPGAGLWWFLLVLAAVTLLYLVLMMACAAFLGWGA